MWLCLLQVVSLSEDKIPVDSDSDDMLKWMDSAKEEQQKYCDSLHIVNWRECKLSDTSKLKKIIWLALSGVSEKEPVEIFTDKQLKRISKIFGSIEKSMKKRKDEKNICMSVLFVLVKAGND
jgi:hypothetical protein